MSKARRTCFAGSGVYNSRGSHSAKGFLEARKFFTFCGSKIENMFRVSVEL